MSHLEKPQINSKNGLFSFLLLALIILSSCTDFDFSGLQNSEATPAQLPTLADPADQPAGPTLTPIAPATLTPTITPPTLTPTIDPTLPDWTILIYMAADNSLDAASVFNINQMEAAQLGDNIQVIVQWDRAADKPWSDTRRYKISQDEDTNTVNSEVLAEIGELNMGDPSVLADFLRWGLTNYPANRTALVVWDHGVGWSGIAEDDTDNDQLTLDELERGLAAGIQDKEGFKFDMVGFDACLMGQLDVYQTLAPYAQAAAASEELTPAAGWPYTQWLNQLSENPKSNGKDAARLATESFINYYSTEAPTDFVTMAAIDLDAISNVSEALNRLTDELSTDINLATSIVAPARAGTEIYAKAYGLNAERYGAIDLSHFAKILAAQSSDLQISALAVDVSTAVDSAVILNDSGRGLPHASGISLYFPNSGRNLDRSYANETANPAWERFLSNYHAAARDSERNAPPEISIIQEPSKSGTESQDDGQSISYGQNNPLWLGFQVSGLDISGVDLLVGQTELNDAGEERLKLFEVDPLVPEPQRLVDGSALYEWQDGLHEDFFIWDSRVTWLKDDFSQGQFVILWATTPDGSGNQRTASGILTDQNSGIETEISLVFNTDSRLSIQAWAFTPDGTPYEISARPGDTFTPFNWVLTNDGLEREPGTRLTLNGASQLGYEWRPLPDGDYKVGFEAKGIADKSNRELIDVSLVQTALDRRSFLDPYTGFQFTYPAEWYQPKWRDQLLFTSNQDGTTTFQVTVFDKAAGLTAQQLQAQAFENFGDVDQLYEDSLQIAGLDALETAYGYTDADGGEHTGLFYTFVSGDQGYLIDLDGLRENEAQTIEIGRNLVNTWDFRPVGEGLFPGKWPTINLENIAVPNPADFKQTERRGWQRFYAGWDTNIFIAFRTETATETPIAEQVSKLAGAAAQGVTGFEETTIFRLAIKDRIWSRKDFSYIASSGQEIWGFIMVTEDEISGEQIMAWAEAPAASYNKLDQNVFAVMLTELKGRE